MKKYIGKKFGYVLGVFVVIPANIIAINFVFFVEIKLHKEKLLNILMIAR